MISENSQIMLPIIALILYSTHASAACSFEGLLAQCPMVLGGHHVDVSARINHCHNPIDVAFLVIANNDRNPMSHNTDTSLRHRPLYWHYTYVTTNHPESREMPGYGQRVLLHVVADTRIDRGGTAKVLKLKAQFLIDGHTDASLTFIDDQVRIPHFDECKYAQEEDRVGSIALGCIVTIIVLCVVGLIGLWLFRPRKGDDDEVDLVNNMERTHVVNNASVDLNVHYVVPRPNESQEATDELSVYISTSTGLKKLERKSSLNSSSNESNSSSNHSHNHGSASGKDEVERSSSKMSSSSNESCAADRSLGAIPKRRQPPPISAPSSPSSCSSSDSSPSR